MRLAAAALLVLLAGCADAFQPPDPPGPREDDDGYVRMSQPGIWVEDDFTTLLPVAETAVALDGDVAYLVGGFTPAGGGDPVVQVLRKDGSADVLDAPYPLPVHHALAAVVDGTLYVFGGYVGGVANPLPGLAGPAGWPRTPTAYRLDLDATPRSWQPIAPLPEARAAGGAAVVDGRILLVGGVGLGDGALATVLAYDPAADAYTELAPLPTPREHLAVVAVGDLVVTVAGRVAGPGGYDDLADVELYHPGNDTWSTGTPLPRPRGGHVATAINGRVVVLGGEVAEGPYSVMDDVDAYDPVHDVWEPLLRMPHPRHGGSAVAWDLELHYVGGAKDDGTLATTGLRLRVR